jgi:hypothetical protein
MEKIPAILLTWVLVGPRGDLGVLKKRIIPCLCPDSITG